MPRNRDPCYHSRLPESAKNTDESSRLMKKPNSSAENPALPVCSNTGLPDFAAIKAEHIVPALQGLVGDYQAGVEQWIDSKAPGDWSFVEAEIEWSDAIENAWSPVSHLNSVADESELRKAYNQGLELLTEHRTWRQQHRGIYSIYEGLRNSAEYVKLSGDQQRIIELELRDFHLSGVDLDEESRAEYRDLVLRISKLGTQFQENLLDATHGWTWHLTQAEDLQGLPDTELRMLAESARVHDKEGWLVDLSYPSYAAIMTYAEDLELRHRLYQAFVTRASDQGPNAGEWDNTPVIEELLALRHRLAQVLGFDNYVEYALSTRMATTPRKITEFLTGLAEQAVPAARSQLQELEEFAAQQGAQLPLEPWDMGFWSERYRQAELKLSDEQLKPYFPLEAMISALFHICGRIFGISMEPDPQVPVWHEDARFYWLHDTDGQRVAGMYMDLYARKQKRGGAWMGVCRSRRQSPEGLQLPVAYLNCNFAPPADGHPSLLTHYDVQTLFHEFGHCLHHMLTVVDWPQINGINNVEWDAVELPSQLLENWCWEEDLLDGFAHHYQTGEALPAKLKKRLLRSHRFQKAIMLARQLEYAICDLRLHLEYLPERPRSPLEIMAEVREDYAIVKAPDWNRFLHSFSHIFGGGYSAGYYSYLWAEQLAADAWERFLIEGAFNPETGASLRREIYSVGASRPAMESFIAFRGREPEAAALLKSYGLAGKDGQTAW